jgi:hypothetical protein
MNPSSGLPREFGLMLAAYKLQLARRAKELGQKTIGTWGKQYPISAGTEERLLEGEGDFRLPPFPYPGLRSFDPKEGKLFFGRDRSVNEVQKRLASYGVVTVLGGSGSGKSSLVRAGLLPYLNSKRRIPGRVGSWYMAEFRPRMNPLCELADALADQVMLPLLDIEAPGLAEAMGLSKGHRGEATKQKLRDKMRMRFQAAQEKGSDAVRNTLLDFVDRDLDDYDHLASEGVRVPGASLMLLVDQFEEVFRPEIAADQRKALLDLVVGLDASIGRRNERNESAYKGGLFLTITMRSEELHRCAEHRGLSEVVNRSVYLLELLDPDNEEDAKELHKAIVQPARDVLDDWGLAYDRNKPDAPFADGMPAWLLSGAGRRLPHQPDQLPLLQHALQATWHAAMRRWSKDDFVDPRLEIRLEDLPGQGDSVPPVPDLGKCLQVRADKAVERARERFIEKAGTATADGETVLQAAFRALAHRDDRGNWVRRFADIADIMAFLAADPNSSLAKLPKEAVQDALSEFVLRGYLSGGYGLPYDISHEALIRNWSHFQEWLREPESAARALERVVQEIDPRLVEERRQKLLDWIPSAVSEQLAPVLGLSPTLPRSWALQHLEPMLERSTVKERWQGLAPNADNRQLAQAVFKEIYSDRQYADRERRREDSRRFRRKVGSLLAVGALLGIFLFWVVLQKSTAALYAAHAEALLGAAVSDRGAQWPPDLRARVTLRASSYFDAASKLGAQWFPDKFAQWLLRDISYIHTGERLSILTNRELLERARSAFDFTSRVVLGRSFVITKSDDKLIEAEPPKCTVIKSPDERAPEWQSLPRPFGDKRHLQPAFRILEGAKLQFGAANESGKTQEADADFQDSLPLGAQLCMSSDATVLTLSSPGQSFPDLYDLQWTPCAPESDCKNNKKLEWRVRAVPIVLAIGPEDLSSPTLFPCVSSIINVPVNVAAGPRRRNLVKTQIRYTAEEAEECLTSVRPVVRSLRTPSPRPQVGRSGGSKSHQLFVAEFYTELAVPRTVDIPDSVKKLLTECKENSQPANTPIPYAEFICRPTYYVDEGSALENDTYIGIRKRRNENEHDILEVDVLDKDFATFAARKVSLPAYHINRAGVTSTGEVLLHDDDAGVTWRFVVARSGLEERLRQRGDCPRLQKSGPKAFQDQEKPSQDLGELAELDIDSVCLDMRK